MMEGLGKESSFCSSRPFQWFDHAENEAPSRWKLSDCFSSFEQTTPLAEKQTDYMESRKPVLDLKDVPPPPPHHAASKPFPLAPLAPLPNPPPCLQTQPQEPLQQQQQQPGGPNVSVCTRCDGSLQLQRGADLQHSRALGCGGVGGSGVPLHFPKPLEIPNSRLACQAGPALHPPFAQVRSSGSCDLRLPSVATSQPLASHQHLPCCSGPLRPLQSFPPVPLTCSQAKLLPSAPSVPASLHGGCLVSSGYYPCSVDYTPGARGDQYFPTRGDLSSSSSHVCTNPLHLNVEHTVCLKGMHYCRECLRKPGRELVSDTEKLWPSMPQLPAQSVPMCNGCGVPGTSADGVLLLGANLSKPSQKHGSPESSGQENLPPVGVFWDIENCSVPSGRSAVAVVQRIRSRFFQGHREAEFICVCDISKENKEVIQELNNCQVTVAHINATAKNAADDKLRQSLRRFAETHTAPATVVLVSSDVNFASELSDLRHRHGFQVILVHKNQASEALLQHAHQHVAFEDFVSDLPPRMPVKQQELCSLEPKTSFHPEKKNRGDTSSPHSNSESAHQPSSKLGAAAESVYRDRRRDCSTPRSMSDSPVDRTDRSVGEFQVSTPSAFSKISLQRTFSPLVLSQGSWSSRSGSPCLSNRSSPLMPPTRSPCPDAPSEPFSNGADIQVANLDYRMSRKELQQILQDAFSKHGRVRSVELSPHTDYQLRATVQMCSLQQAISAVSRLHRYKIGGKRIHVSLITGANNKTLTHLSSEIISILQDAPACCLPLFKFTEIYEKKFGHKLAVSDLYKLTEVVAVRDQGSSRLVCLLPSSQARQSPLGSSQSHDGSSASCSPVVFEELEYHEPVCKHHYTQNTFSESDFDPDSYKIPFVVLSLKAFAAQVHSLLQTHEGTVPLLSFPECYAAEFSPLKLGEEGEVEGAVPLEHLITCIPGINIVTAQNGFKVIKWIHNKPPPPNADPWVQRCKSPVGNPQLIQFSREIIDLMKSQPCCIMPINKFIPSYHHHFAKQCRVSDYGYSKLLELLEAVPHVLQILGMGSKRLLTLTHRAQVKRFTQDLLKLLKFQVSKQVVIQDFMQAYHWCFSRDWRVIEYGMCDLMDLLAEIPDTTITITQQNTDTLISIPKRERTPEEMERTKQFAKEVVDLLRHQPHCRMSFSKFIPSYHHHFGRQCKLTYYGFTKLMELFEAIPEVLQVLECGEEKILTLTEMEKLKALAAQFVKLLRSQKDNSLPMSELLTEYSKTFGYGLRLQDFDVSSVPALLQKLCHVVKVVDGPDGREVQLINRKSLRSLTTQLLALLMSLPDGKDSLTVEELSQQYEAVHSAPLNPCEYGFVSLSELLKSLPYLVELSESEGGGGEEQVRLTRLYQFARSVRALLLTYHYNQIFLTEFSGAFSKYTGRGLQPRSYGYSTVDELLGAIPQVVWIKGHGHKKIIVLKNDMKGSDKGGLSARTSPVTTESPQPEREGSGSPCSATEPRAQSPAGSGTETELLCLSSGSPVDLLCGPVPSCLPSPQLHPDPVLPQQTDLIRFEEQPATPLESEKPDAVSAAPDVCEGIQGLKDPVASPARAAQLPPAEVPSVGSKQPQPPALKAAVATDSPSRRASRNRVKLAANFSFAPVTRL
ncbi:meiosis regulator and mRNA stability factor 1 isoform X3 [Megalops cyprinoides]|uniref:meiosis regulator and mRNA stability factor 1 isoform X3 n=1 Tax=Megalops cyprinoides TaxID=118141 RepID=UPI001864D1E6|nr:meiosis regulator and mRNA stability factor 1 isoform X3 [Megalops cyprinoides]